MGAKFTIWATSKIRADTPHRPPHHRQRSGKPSRHEQPRKNGISVRNDRHTIGYDPGNLHAMSNHTPEQHPGRTHRPLHHHSAGRWHIPVKSVLTYSIPMDFSVGGPAARAWALTKNQFALTVKKLTCFLGVDLRIAVFWKFGFWYIYLEQKNIKTAHFSALKQPKTIPKTRHL